MSDHDRNIDEVDRKEEGKPFNPDNSDRENDTFEDANDFTPLDRTPTTARKSSMRSLTPLTTAGHIELAEIPAADKDTMDEGEQTRHPKSPLLTSHRLSGSSLDNVNLEEDDAQLEDSKVTKLEDAYAKPAIPTTKPVKPRVMGSQEGLPSLPKPAPPLPPAGLKGSPSPATRKITSRFAWLSRSPAAKEPSPPPSLPPPPQPGNSGMLDRRNTSSSIGTLNSNSDMMVNKMEEGNDSDNINARQPARNSLRDRFKVVRMREEAGIASLGENDPAVGVLNGLIGRRASISLGLVSPTTMDGHPTSPLTTIPNPPTINSALAPGTAAGVSAGPSAVTYPVDWDLWQAVVYEGPAAVARTSPEELNSAIATGIPNAIRGVVWQVLAQSKNEELESVYRDLLSRGTDQDKDRTGGSSMISGLSNGSASTKDKEAVTSSASSIHSDHSTLGTTAVNGIRSPSPSRFNEKDAESIAKAHAEANAERKRKAKEDAASLQKLEKAIKRDLGARTSFSKFAVSAGLQDGLFGVCKAYALFDEGVGYAQGMNFLAMPLLFNMPEEEAFCLLVRLMNQYHLRDLFTQDMPGLHLHLYQFNRLLEDFEPALYCHLHRRQVTPHLYATQWFLTLFAYRFPLQLVLRIYDLILSEGLEAILKFGIVLMQKNAETLLGMNDMVTLTTFLKDRLFDVYIDASPSAGSIKESGFFGSSAASIDKEVYRADVLVQDACAVKITPELLKAYSTEWEEMTKAEAVRETEVEFLKSSNASLSLKVRRLEERVEENDSEHAALATKLVRTKVENEELKDENESLKLQVEELKRVIEKQPEEVEQRLKSEMDRLMKRNQEVHEENSRLEEEIGEIEKTLVETKMQYAEINSQHEALTRRWTDLRKALD